MEFKKITTIKITWCCRWTRWRNRFCCWIYKQAHNSKSCELVWLFRL